MHVSPFVERSNSHHPLPPLTRKLGGERAGRRYPAEPGLVALDPMTAMPDAENRFSGEVYATAVEDGALAVSIAGVGRTGYRPAAGETLTVIPAPPSVSTIRSRRSAVARLYKRRFSWLSQAATSTDTGRRYQTPRPPEACSGGHFRTGREGDWERYRRRPSNWARADWRRNRRLDPSCRSPHTQHVRWWAAHRERHCRSCRRERTSRWSWAHTAGRS
jgi:hypothetical protein